MELPCIERNDWYMTNYTSDVFKNIYTIALSVRSCRGSFLFALFKYFVLEPINNV